MSDEQNVVNEVSSERAGSTQSAVSTQKAPPTQSTSPVRTHSISSRPERPSLYYPSREAQSGSREAGSSSLKDFRSAWTDAVSRPGNEQEADPRQELQEQKEPEQQEESSGQKSAQAGAEGRDISDSSWNPEVDRSNRPNAAYNAVTGTPFIRGEGDRNDIDPNDVKQGNLGDCYVFGAMAAIARQNPEAIRNAIKDNGNGTYTVNFRGLDRQVTVDGNFPQRNGENIYGSGGDRDNQGNTELWPMLIEKAWAKLNGGYENIAGGNYLPGSGGFMQALTGQQTEALRAREALQVDESEVKPNQTPPLQPTQVPAEELFTRMNEAFRNGRAMTFGTIKTKDPGLESEIDARGLSAWHGYAITNVEEVNGQRRITAFNPWGTTSTYDFNEIARYLDRVYIN